MVMPRSWNARAAHDRAPGRKGAAASGSLRHKISRGLGYIVVETQLSLKASASTLWRCADLGGPWWAQHSTRTDRSASAPSTSARSPDGTASLAGFSSRPSCWPSKSNMTRSASRCSRELPGGSSWSGWTAEPSEGCETSAAVRPLSGFGSLFPSHSFTIFPSGPDRRRTLPACSNSRQIWLTLCRGEMPAWSVS